MSIIRVEPMGLIHLDAVHELEVRSFAIPWSKNEIRRDMTENKHAYYFVALETETAFSVNGAVDGKLNAPVGNNTGSKIDPHIGPHNKVVGYAGMWHIVNEGHINNIAVDELYRRRGVGSLLMDTLIKKAHDLDMIGLTLEVRVGNRPAMGLYHRYGFKAEGYRKNYYADTKEDAVIMWKYFGTI